MLEFHLKSKSVAVADAFPAAAAAAAVVLVVVVVVVSNSSLVENRSLLFLLDYLHVHHLTCVLFLSGSIRLHTSLNS